MTGCFCFPSIHFYLPCPSVKKSAGAVVINGYRPVALFMGTEKGIITLQMLIQEHPKKLRLGLVMSLARVMPPARAHTA
jgi:hypothetical protein